MHTSKRKGQKEVEKVSKKREGEIRHTS